jgi:hypothetical protein
LIETSAAATTTPRDSNADADTSEMSVDVADTPRPYAPALPDCDIHDGTFFRFHRDECDDDDDDDDDDGDDDDGDDDDDGRHGDGGGGGGLRHGLKKKEKKRKKEKKKKHFFSRSPFTWVVARHSYILFLGMLDHKWVLIKDYKAISVKEKKRKQKKKKHLIPRLSTKRHDPLPSSPSSQVQAQPLVSK